MLPVLQFFYPTRWSITDFLIWVVIVIAAIALVSIALRHFQVEIPSWASQVLWIVVIAFVVIFAIRVVASM